MALKLRKVVEEVQQLPEVACLAKKPQTFVRCGQSTKLEMHEQIDLFGNMLGKRTLESFLIFKPTRS